MQTPAADRDPVTLVGVLAEPTRRALYEYVASSAGAVARDEAAAAVGVGVPLAAFHLDRLVAAGLLAAEYRRRSERRGPGAGRPAKLYRRAPGAVEVSLPARQYALAADLLAEALSAVEGNGLDALREAARARGRAMAATAGQPGPGEPTTAAPTDGQGGPQQALMDVLAANGFEPWVAEEDGVIRLRNCPFDALARDHRGIACPMNVALLEGVADEIGGVVAVPDETPGFCCVALRPAEMDDGAAPSHTPQGY